MDRGCRQPFVVLGRDPGVTQASIPKSHAMRWRGRSERVPRWEKRLMLENDQNKCVYSYICCYRKYEHENLDLREETLQIRDRVEWEREYDGIRCTIGR